MLHVSEKPSPGNIETHHLKGKRKEFQCFSQSEIGPARQRVFLQQHMEKCKSAMQKKTLTLEQLMVAERQIIQHSQDQWFPEEVKALRCNLIIKRNSQLYKLDPSLQDGLMTVGGRLEKSAMPKDAKPVFLSAMDVTTHSLGGSCPPRY